ncbi:hypothetical protein [Porphyromonas cangingivalis]|uniref:hypothetical protein n=1 Tax=Porphyromonas cangingivalis TaxID=36874 RepID=UPI00051CD3BA|nr:hypothetical protein [Porphyromonas cangingivalis]KGL50069.1 hypothetical protein HQ34_01720 [Porphyromonas cangingivalis]
MSKVQGVDFDALSDYPSEMTYNAYCLRLFYMSECRTQDNPAWSVTSCANTLKKQAPLELFVVGG